MHWLLAVSCLLVVRDAPQALTYSVLSGWPLQVPAGEAAEFEFGIGAAVASATMVEMQPIKAWPYPSGRSGQLAV